MKFWFVVWSGLTRRRLRSVLSLLSVLVAFFLYGLLAAVRAGFAGGVEVSGADRLITTHKMSITQFLPEVYQQDIAAIEGVESVTHATWFGGVYRDPMDFFAQLVVDQETFLALHPEFVVSDEERRDWLENRSGVLVGRTLADRFGWRVGDRVPIQGTLWTHQETAGLWEFEVEGIFEGSGPGVDTSTMLIRYDYFDEARSWGHGYVGWYLVRIADPARAAAVGRAIDEQFVNSFFETRTVPEDAFLESLARQVGDLGTITLAVLAIVFFTMLMVVGNAMAQSWRERMRELGVLQAIGYSHLRVSALILAEALLLCVIGGGAGLLLARLAVASGDPTGGLLPGFHLSGSALAAGALLLLATGLAAGLLPSLATHRMRPADALRRPV